jgi:CheY-like chemotaxis protein
MAGLHILCVDDDPDTCASLSDILTDLGYRVDVAYDGPSALQLVKRNGYGLALRHLVVALPGYAYYTRLHPGGIGATRNGVQVAVVMKLAASAFGDDLCARRSDTPKYRSLLADSVDVTGATNCALLLRRCTPPSSAEASDTNPIGLE